MNVSEPGIAWGHACRSLQEVGQELHRQAQQPYAPQFAALQRVIEALNHGGAMRPRRCPAAYVVEWQRYVLDPTHRLPSRAIRYLCWEPSVALDAQFQSYLDVELGTLSTAMLHGLVWCCHACWSPAFAASAAVQWVQQQLLAYNGDNWLLQYWQQHVDVLLQPSGPRDLGLSLVAMRVPIPALCQAWGIDARSPYVLTVLREAMDHCLREMESDPSLSAYLVATLLPWDGWTVEDFRVAVTATVLHPVIDATPGMPEQVTKLVLADARLGDPRLPSRQSFWAEVPEQARQLFVQWLAIADMNFFFDHVLPESKDQEERKAFWLLYAPRVVRSRPLLHATDILRLKTMLRQNPESTGHFGRMHDTASGLILDFGALVVVQVSDVSQACYIYGKRSFEQLLPDFWQAQPLAGATLLVAAHAATIAHDHKWEREVGEIFAQYSIRATYKEAA